MANTTQKIKFLDVGHGDSAVIFLKDTDCHTTKTVMIDIVDADKAVAELAKEDVRILDLLIISHFDSDHCKGVNDFLEKFLARGKVKYICYHVDRWKPTQMMRLLVRRFAEPYRLHHSVILGAHFDTNMNKRELIEDASARLSVIYPNEYDDTIEYLNNNTNNKSVVCILESAVCMVLFPGDLEAEGWERLLNRMSALECHILKMPHHGAYDIGEKAGGTDWILKKLKPQVAIISTKEHKKYRHPALETIEALKNNGVQIYCTEYTNLCHCSTQEMGRKCYGDIEVIVNKSGYHIHTEENRMISLDHPACKIFCYTADRQNLQ